MSLGFEKLRAPVLYSLKWFLQAGSPYTFENISPMTQDSSEQKELRKPPIADWNRVSSYCKTIMLYCNLIEFRFSLAFPKVTLFRAKRCGMKAQQCDLVFNGPIKINSAGRDRVSCWIIVGISERHYFKAALTSNSQLWRSTSCLLRDETFSLQDGFILQRSLCNTSASSKDVP